MSQKPPSIASVLKDNGLSITKQRLYVFGLLENAQPVSMAELYAQAKHNLDRASLYRIIATFEELGVVSRINIGWKYKLELSDRFTEHHHHLSCLRCQAVIPINEAALESFITSVANDNGFTPLEHQVEVQGYCKSCTAPA